MSGTVILYADEETDSIRRAVDETARRRALQEAYNAEHHITPVGITKSLEQIDAQTQVGDSRRRQAGEDAAALARDYAHLQVVERIAVLEEEMRKEAAELNFEAAASLRDLVAELKLQLAAGGEEQL